MNTKENLRVTEGWEVDPTSGIDGRALGLFKHEHTNKFRALLAGSVLVPIALAIGMWPESQGLHGFVSALSSGAAYQLNSRANNAISVLKRVIRRETR